MVLITSVTYELQDKVALIPYMLSQMALYDLLVQWDQFQCSSVSANY